MREIKKKKKKKKGDYLKLMLAALNVIVHIKHVQHSHSYSTGCTKQKQRFVVCFLWPEVVKTSKMYAITVQYGDN
jgi:hypothetical protein